MLDQFKANLLFHLLLKRPKIDRAYRPVPPSDPWYDTISTVHRSLDTVRQLPHRVMHLTAGDGARLQGVYYPGTGNTTVIWIHGYTSHAERESAFPALFYHSLGFSVLVPYLRAHGPSQGKYISCGPLECRDMALWAAHLRSLRPEETFVLHGLSMGANIVLYAAAEEIPGLACVIADAPSPGVTQMFTDVSKQVFHDGWEPVCRQALARYRREFGVEAQAFQTVEAARRCRCPLFLTAGSEEHLEPLLEQLRQACPRETEVLILPGCNHGNGMYRQTALYQEALKAFLGRNLP